MAEIVSYNEFDPVKLGRQLHELVIEEDTARQLGARLLAGVPVRYGAEAGVDGAVESVRKGQRDNVTVRNGEGDGPLHFAVVDDAGNVRGAASLYTLDRLPLRIVPPAIPTGLLPKWAGVRLDAATDYASAWVQGEPNNDTSLGIMRDVLEQLRAVAHSPALDTLFHTVAAEPLRAMRRYPGLAEVMRGAGLEYVITAPLDDNDNRRRPAPVSAIYADIKGHDLTRWGKLYELATGQPG